MKLRMRSLESKETQKLEVPDEFSIQQLKEFLSHYLCSNSTLASSLRLSLNRKDELSDDSLVSIGMTSGDLIYYDFSSPFFHQQGNLPSNLQDFNIRNPIMDVKPSVNSKESDVVSLISPNQQSELHIDKGKETSIEKGKSQIEDEKLKTEELVGGEFIHLDTGSGGRRFYELYFLRRVLCEDMGNDLSDTKLVFLAIHAVFLESGFVGFDSMSGLRVDLFDDVLKEQASMTYSTYVSYTLPKLLSDDNDITKSIILNFQTVGHRVNVYGSLGTTQLGLYKLNIDKSRFVPAIGTFWVTSDTCERLNEKDSSIADAEKIIFEFWKFVKDGLALPLLIDLCENTGLDLPPCLSRLPADLKFRILELLPGQDVAKVACVCKEMKYLSSTNELWKEKYISEFCSGSGAVSTVNPNWKKRFASSWENSKKSYREGKRIRTHNPFGLNPFGGPGPLPGYWPNPFGVPVPLPGHGPYPFGVPEPPFGVPGPLPGHGPYPFGVPEPPLGVPGPLPGHGPDPFGVPGPLPGHGPNPFGVPGPLPGHGPNPLGVPEPPFGVPGPLPGHGPNPFGVPEPLPGHGPNPFGVPVPLPGHGPNPFGVPGPLPGHGPNPFGFIYYSRS